VVRSLYSKSCIGCRGAIELKSENVVTEDKLEVRGPGKSSQVTEESGADEVRFEIVGCVYCVELETVEGFKSDPE